MRWEVSVARVANGAPPISLTGATVCDDGIYLYP